MLAEHFRHPRGQGLDGIQFGRETLRIGLVQIDGHVAVLDAVRESHAGAASRGNADRVHAAAQKQTARLRCLAQHERAVRCEALGTVQQHPDFDEFKHRDPVKRVDHHRLEMVPVLG